MTRLYLFFAAVWVMSLCGITYAQDRGWASSIAWSPDGETIAIGSSTGVWFFDTEFNELGYVEVKHSEVNSVRSLDWNAAGDLLAVAYPMEAYESPIQIIDVSKLEIINEIDSPGLWTPVLWHPEDNLVIGGLYVGKTYIWDATTGKELFFFDGRAAKPDAEWYETLGFCWLTENTVAIVNSQTINVVDIVENMIVQTFNRYFGVKAPVCNRDYQILSTSGRLFDLQTGSDTKLFNGSYVTETYGDLHYTLTVAWSPESDRILTSAEVCRIRVFDGQNGELIADLRGGIYLEHIAFSFFPDSITWHPDGSRFAVVGQFGDIRVWDAETYELLQRFDGFEWGFHAYFGVLDQLSEEERNAIDVNKLDNCD